MGLTTLEVSSSNHRKQTIVIHKLPPEVALQILKCCTDVSSLHGLVQCHPFRSVFKAYPAEILQHLFDADDDNVHVPYEIRVLMRGVLGVRTNLCMLHSLEEAQMYPCGPPYASPPVPRADETQPVRYATVVESNNRRYLRARAQKIWPPLPQAFSSDDPSSAITLIKFLALSHQIHCLAHACLDFCLGQLHQVPEFPTDSQESAYELCPQPCDAFSPPSWIEEHRALRGLWMLQLFYELQRARERGRLLWSSEDLDQLKQQTVEGFLVGGFRCDTVLSLMECLERIMPDAKAAHASLRLPAVGNELQCGIACEPNLFPRRRYIDRSNEAWCRMREQRSDYERSSRLKYLLPAGKSADVSNFDPSGRQHEWHIWRPSFGWTFGSASMVSLNVENGLGKARQFTPFQRFGMAFWEERRIVALGLWSRQGAARVRDFYERWRGLLTPEERETYAE